jgi:CHAD domain-containing protein
MAQTLISPNQPAIEVALATLKEALALVMQYFEQVTRVRTGNLGGRGIQGGPSAQANPGAMEQVHQLRVSTRRATAALAVFEDFLPRRAARRLRRTLSELRRKAGVARDYDVFATRFQQDEQDEASRELLATLEAMRAQGHAKLLTLYEQWNHGEIMERRATEALCAVRPRRKQADRPDENFASFAPRCLRRMTRQFFNDHDTDPKSLKRLHSFRIRVKRLRYCLELLRPGLEESTFTRSYGLVKKLAQRLGDINDHAMAERLLEELLNCHDAGPRAELLTRKLHSERHALGEAVSGFKRWWTGRRHRRLRKRLKRTASSDIARERDPDLDE